MTLRPESDGESQEPGPGTVWFYGYIDRINAQPTDLPLRCPCCYCKTLSERGHYDICQICFWEDDGQDDYDADVVRGGPNGALSLTEARDNYRRFGACDERSVNSVRPARPNELPDG
jgi:Cysteine-rich CPCC